MLERDGIDALVNDAIGSMDAGTLASGGLPAAAEFLTGDGILASAGLPAAGDFPTAAGFLASDGLLAAEERALVEWLRADDLRAIKAEPTARYFQDMRESFRQMRNALAPGAIAVVVSGRQSTFYQFSTREPLYVVDSARLLAEGAREAGFEVEELLDVELAKSNRNARPRSLDEYYETLIILRRPQESSGPGHSIDRVSSCSLADRGGSRALR